MRWVHIDFWFNLSGPAEVVDRYLYPEDQKDFESLIKRIILEVKPKRKFYLWEHKPHCFLALEVANLGKVKKVVDHLKKNLRANITYRKYIENIELNTKASSDNCNGQGFLNVLNAFTDFYLFQRDNKISHVVHCCLEPIFQVRQLENEFYQNMATMYQDVKLDDKGEKVYSYKKITPEMRDFFKSYTDLHGGKK
jgi:hypothetical protein